MTSEDETSESYEEAVKSWATQVLNEFVGRRTITAKEFQDAMGWTRRQMKAAIDSGDIHVIRVDGMRDTIPLPELERLVNGYVEEASRGTAA